MSMREAMVRRVLGEKWLVIMTLMPASEKVSWWGYADSSSSTIRTEGLQWKLAAEKVPITDEPKKKQSCRRLPFFSRTAVASHVALSSRSVLPVSPLVRFKEVFFF